MSEQQPSQQTGAYKKKAKRRSGEEPELHADVDFRTLAADKLDGKIEKISPNEWQCAQAFSFWPKPHDPYLKAQSQFMDAMLPRKDYLIWYRQKNTANKPLRRRAKLIVQFFIELLSKDELQDNPDLQDAICYRIACWLVCGVFDYDAGKEINTQGWEPVIGQQDPVKFYERIVEAAVRHFQTTNAPTM